MKLKVVREGQGKLCRSVGDPPNGILNIGGSSEEGVTWIIDPAFQPGVAGGITIEAGRRVKAPESATSITVTELIEAADGDRDVLGFAIFALTYAIEGACQLARADLLGAQMVADLGVLLRETAEAASEVMG